MQKIKFEDRAVAFIDVLGFKQVVDAASQGGHKHTELTPTTPGDYLS